MTSRLADTRLRKPPAERRAEIVSAAAQVALTEGLECITLRRVAELLNVRPSLIGHYFPAVEDLVAEAFGHVAEGELSTLVLTGGGDGTPKQRLVRFLAQVLSEQFQEVNRLWLNARHLARYRPTLRDRLIVQGDHWRDRLAALIQEGMDSGDFARGDAEVVSLKILVAVDGLCADLNADPKFPDAVRRLAVDIAESELGLPRGTLRHGRSAT